MNIRFRRFFRANVLSKNQVENLKISININFSRKNTDFYEKTHKSPNLTKRQMKVNREASKIPTPLSFEFDKLIEICV